MCMCMCPCAIPTQPMLLFSNSLFFAVNRCTSSTPLQDRGLWCTSLKELENCQLMPQQTVSCSSSGFVLLQSILLKTYFHAIQIILFQRYSKSSAAFHWTSSLSSFFSCNSSCFMLPWHTHISAQSQYHACCFYVKHVHEQGGNVFLRTMHRAGSSKLKNHYNHFQKEELAQ